MIYTGTTNSTYYYENEERVYPCYCGEIHRGDFAAEDWNHHNCFHREPLTELPRINSEVRQAVCIDCGEIFDLEGAVED